MKSLKNTTMTVNIYLNNIESEILEKLMRLTGDTKSGVFKKALFEYNNFINQEKKGLTHEG